MNVDLLERLEQPLVEKPGIDDQDRVTVLECDGALAPERDLRAVEAIDPDQVFRAGRPQGASRPATSLSSSDSALKV